MPCAPADVLPMQVPFEVASGAAKALPTGLRSCGCQAMLVELLPPASALPALVWPCAWPWRCDCLADAEAFALASARLDAVAPARPMPMPTPPAPPAPPWPPVPPLPPLFTVPPEPLDPPDPPQPFVCWPAPQPPLPLP